MEFITKYLESELGFSYLIENKLSGLLTLLISILISCFVILKKNNKIIWVQLILITMSYSMINLSLVKAYKNQKYEKRYFADELLSVFNSETKPKLIYRDDKSVAYGAFSYLKTNIKILTDKTDLKELENKIFLITQNVPHREDLKWTKISSVIYKDITYSLWEGVK